LLEKDYKGYYIILQDKQNSSKITFEKAGEGVTGEQAVTKLKELTGSSKGDSEKGFRGVIIKNAEDGVYVYSPEEPNPDNDPSLVGYNPQHEMIGEFIQEKDYFTDEVTDEKEAGIDVECESEETNEQWVERVSTFATSLIKKYTGSKCKFFKKQPFTIITYRSSDGSIKSESYQRWTLYNALVKFVRSVVTTLKQYDNDDEPVEFALFNKKKLVLSSAEYEDDVTQIMIGEAIRIKAMAIPK